MRQCDLCSKHGFNEPARHTIVVDGKELHLCDDCALDHFNIDQFYPPQFNCAHCWDTCSPIHYIDSKQRHFCSARCAVNYHIHHGD
jgi:hypothetical protein